MNHFVIKATRQFLRPLVKLLLRNNVTFKQMTELCKMAYVEVASNEYGIRGREVNASKVSILTGLSRREIKRVKDLLDDNAQSLADSSSKDRLTRILSAWYQDENFCDENGGRIYCR